MAKFTKENKLMTQYLLKYNRGSKQVTELFPSLTKFGKRKGEIKAQRRKILEEAQVEVKIEKSVPILD